MNKKPKKSKPVIDDIDIRIKEFVEKMKAKKSPFATDEETKLMFDLYNEKFKMQKNWQAEKTCSICVSRVFRDLEKHLKRIKK